MLNPHALGLTDYCIFFRAEGAEANARKKIINTCLRAHDVAYLAELGGHYQWSMSIFCSSIFDVEKFFKTLSDELPHTAFTYTFAIRAEWILLHRSYLSAHLPHQTPLIRAESPQNNSLDGRDRVIINGITQHPGFSVNALSKIIQIPEATIRRRVQFFHESKILIGIPYHIDSTAIGVLAFRVLIQLRQQSLKTVSAIRSFAQKHMNSSAFVRCFGSWDIEINFEVSEAEAAGRFVQQLYDRFGINIYSTQLLNELKIHKLHNFQFSNQ